MYITLHGVSVVNVCGFDMNHYILISSLSLPLYRLRSSVWFLSGRGLKMTSSSTPCHSTTFTASLTSCCAPCGWEPPASCFLNSSLRRSEPLCALFKLHFTSVSCYTILHLSILKCFHIGSFSVTLFFTLHFSVSLFSFFPTCPCFISSPSSPL